MKLKLEKLVKIEQGLKEISKINFSNNKVNYWMGRMINKINSEKKIYSDLMDKKLKEVRDQFFKKDDKGEFVMTVIPKQEKTDLTPEIPEQKVFTPIEGKTMNDAEKAFTDYQKELDVTEVEFDFNKIKLSDLDKPVSAEILADLEDIIEE